MDVIEIYLDDLCEEKRNEIIEALGGEVGNYDIFPIAEFLAVDEEYL